MYPVSEEFLQAVQGNTRKYYWSGKITTAGGVERQRLYHGPVLRQFRD